MSKRIFIVDDHSLLTDTLAAAIGASPGLEVAGTAASGTEALDRLAVTECAVLLADFGLPDMTGASLIRKVKQDWPDLRTILMTGATLAADEIAALTAIAGEMISKGDPVAQLIARLQSSGPKANGEGAEVSGLGEIDALTATEREVLAQFAEGITIDEVAASREISPWTVRKHRQNIMEKLGLRSPAALIRVAVLAGLRASG